MRLNATSSSSAVPPYRTAWPTQEVAAIDSFNEALLRACLANGGVEGGWSMRGGAGYHCSLRIDGVITMLMRAGWDAARILDVWNTAPDPSAALHLAELRFRLQTDARGTRLDNPHLAGEYAQAAYAIGAFATSARATLRIEAAFFETEDPAAQTLLSDALFLG